MVNRKFHQEKTTEKRRFFRKVTRSAWIIRISFETAVYVFDDPYYIEMFDFEHSVNEDRYIAIGKVGDVLFVVFTERKETIRLISARLATNAEKELYYDQNIN